MAVRGEGRFTPDRHRGRMRHGLHLAPNTPAGGSDSDTWCALMIEWRDEALVLASRPHGETGMIVDIFTAERGRDAGIVRGGISRKMRPHLQPGEQIAASWRARLEDHLGTLTIEPVRSRAAHALADRLALAGMTTVCALLREVLPEREPHPALYARSTQLLDLLAEPDLWPLAYLRWEQALLEEMGFGLDLSACAVRGVNEDLCYVSPKSGRAVSREGAGEWADRMLPLPPVLAGKGEATGPEIARALATTGFFLEKRLMRSLGDRPVPAARGRLVDAIARS